MNDIVTAVARVLAREQGRAIPIRQTCALSPDPLHIFGIAPIRVVSEQRVQAVAFGNLGEDPQLVVSWNPLSRETASLEPFASALSTYLQVALASGELPRVWLPHRAALEVIDILGHRYRRNSSASDSLRRMGWFCHALVEESSFPGQQVVAIAAEQLLVHVVTGQSPIEDRQLRALLAWIEPSPGVDPVERAAQMALIPAAAMLERRIDDQVERLRKVAKGNTSEAQDARLRIEALLRRSAEAEWDLLVRAREAFWRLGLPFVGHPDLIVESQRRFQFALQQDLNPPSRPHSLSKLLDEQEYAKSLTEEVFIRADRLIREKERHSGHVMSAEVVGINQPRPNFTPCTLTLRIEQEVVRVRLGTHMQTINGVIAGRVSGLREDLNSGARLVELAVTKGVRSRPALGSNSEWIGSVLQDFRYRKSLVYSTMKVEDSPLVYGDQLPPASPRNLPDSDLIGIADQLRR